MKDPVYNNLKTSLINSGYSEEIEWQTNLQPVTWDMIFRNEAIWVILNSGMKEQIARQISNKIWRAFADSVDISEVFGHEGKVAAIKHILADYASMFEGYQAAEDKLAYLETIPYIGKITKYHLAKNLGLDVVKPDRHLVRIAVTYGVDCNTLCKNISEATGDKVSVVDIVLWRSANLGWI